MESLQGPLRSPQPDSDESAELQRRVPVPFRALRVRGRAGPPAEGKGFGQIQARLLLLGLPGRQLLDSL